MPVPLIEKLTELPEHTDCDGKGCKVIVGGLFTVNAEVVLLQPVVEFVKVKFTFPAVIPDTNPVLSIAATELLLLVHVPPVDGVNCAVPPPQAVEGPPSTGIALTVILKVTVLLQPFPLVTL